MTVSSQQICEWLQGKEWSLKQWLSIPAGRTHPRPSFEILQKQHDLEIIQHLIEIYKDTSKK
jgi:hypothetical protein